MIFHYAYSTSWPTRYHIYARRFLARLAPPELHAISRHLQARLTYDVHDDARLYDHNSPFDLTICDSNGPAF